MKIDLLSFVVPALINGGNRISRSGASVARWSLPTNHSGEGREIPPITSTLQISQLMYEFESVRNIVSKHEKTFNEDLSPRLKKKRTIVEFDTPALVDTRNSAAKPFPAAKLKNPVSAAAILEFLKLNQKYIRHAEGKNPKLAENGDNEDKPFMAVKLEALQSEFDADIVEFDDEFANSGIESTLVYSIVVNRKNKRITIVFRGSVSPKDWAVDLRLMKTIRAPKIIRNFTGDRNLMLHKGFADYLLGKSVAEKKRKVNEIINILKELYAFKDESNGRDYSDYELYITGHSLGGALTQLLSFVLAGAEEASFIPKPINAISFASPIVGAADYLEEFQKLEKAGKLRHIRVSNQNDVVPAEEKEYKQTGVNFHVKEGEKMEVAYLNGKTLRSLLRFDSVDRHSLEGEGSYFTRLYAKDGSGEYLNKADLDKPIEQLYTDYVEL